MAEINVDSLVREVDRLKKEIKTADENVGKAREKAKAVARANNAKLKKLLPVIALYDKGQLPHASMRPEKTSTRLRAAPWPEIPETCLLPSHPRSKDGTVPAKTRGLCANHMAKFIDGRMDADERAEYLVEARAWADEYDFKIDDDGQVIE